MLFHFAHRYTVICLGVLFCAGLAVSSTAAPPAPVPAAPIRKIEPVQRDKLLGSWLDTDPDGAYTTTYTFRDDGTCSVEVNTKAGQRNNLTTGRWFLNRNNLYIVQTHSNSQPIEEKSISASLPFYLVEVDADKWVHERNVAYGKVDRLTLIRVNE